jgi:Mg2+-importing ATPase
MLSHDASVWSRSGAEVLQQLETSLKGLPTDEARRRHDEHASDLLKPRRRSSDLVLFLSQFGSPLILILLVAAGLAFFLADRTDTAIILTIVLVSGVLGFWLPWEALFCCICSQRSWPRRCSIGESLCERGWLRSGG